MNKKKILSSFEKEIIIKRFILKEQERVRVLVVNTLIDFIKSYICEIAKNDDSSSISLIVEIVNNLYYANGNGYSIFAAFVRSRFFLPINGSFLNVQREKNPFFYDNCLQGRYNLRTALPEIFYLTPVKDKKETLNFIIAADFECTNINNDSNLLVDLPKDEDNYNCNLIEEIIEFGSENTENKWQDLYNISRRSVEKDRELKDKKEASDNLKELKDDNKNFDNSSNLTNNKDNDYIDIVNFKAGVNQYVFSQVSNVVFPEESPSLKLFKENPGFQEILNKKAGSFKKSQYITSNVEKNSAVSVVIASSYKFHDKKAQVFKINRNVFKGDLDSKSFILESDRLISRFILNIVKDAKKILKEKNQDKIKFNQYKDFYKGRDYIPNDNNVLDPNCKEKFIVYMHNFARYDGFLLLKSMLRNQPLREFLNFDETSDVFMINNQILQIKIGSIYFLDSYKMINYSLKNLISSLLGKNSPQKLDYDFKLIENYDAVKKVFNSKKLLRDLLFYNKQDSILLYSCMIKVQQEVFSKLNFDISNSLTNPSVGMNLFLTKYYTFSPQNLLIPIKKQGKNQNIFNIKLENTSKLTLKNHSEGIFISKPFLDFKIREAFFGGRSEVFKPYVVDGIYVDANSLYPFAAKAPLPYGSPILKTLLENNKFYLKDFNSFMGFLKIKWVSPADQNILPVLPRRHPLKYNVYALGCGIGYFYIKEVLLALKMGYKICILESIQYQAKAGLKKIMEDGFKMRGDFPKPHPLNTFAKLYCNSLSYGKFSIKILTKKTKFFCNNNSKKQQEKIILFCKSVQVSKIVKLKNTYISIIYYCEKYKDRLTPKNLTIKKALTFKNPKININNDDQNYLAMKNYKIAKSCPHISAAVTSQARVFMYYFLSLMYKSNNLIYTDTDSIVFKSAGSHLIKKRLNDIKFGFFKTENIINEGEFPASKIYILKTKDENDKTDTLVKFKGVPSRLISTLEFDINLEYDTKNEDLLVINPDHVDDNIIDESYNLVQTEDLKPCEELGNEDLFNIMQNSRIKGKTFSGVLKDVFTINRDSTTFDIVSKKINSIETGNKNVAKYRKMIHKKKSWVDTNSLILDEDFKPISLAQLKKMYNKFISNID